MTAKAGDLLTPNESELAERYRRFYPWLDQSAPCQYAAHRASDWRLSDGHPWVCGICHPPAVNRWRGSREPAVIARNDPATRTHDPAPKSPTKEHE